MKKIKVEPPKGESAQEQAGAKAAAGCVSFIVGAVILGFVVWCITILFS